MENLELLLFVCEELESTAEELSRRPVRVVAPPSSVAEKNRATFSA